MHVYDSRRSTDLGDTSERGFGCEESIGRIAQLFDLVRGKLMCPFLWLRAIFFRIPHGRTGDLLRELLEWHNVLVKRIVLTGCSQSIGKDMEGSFLDEIVRRRGR